MGAKESEAMKKAKKLVLEKGMNASQAAKKVGLTKSAIYMTEWWKNERLQNKQLPRIQECAGTGVYCDSFGVHCD